MKFWNRKKKLPMGSKVQGGLDRFKFKASYNNLEESFFISLTDRQDPWLTQRLNINAEEFKHILDGMVVAYEQVVYPNNSNTSEDVDDHECDCSERDYDDPRQDLD